MKWPDHSWSMEARLMATKPHSDKNYAVVIKMNAINNFVLFLFYQKRSRFNSWLFFYSKNQIVGSATNIWRTSSSSREHCEAGGDFIKTTQKVASLHSVIESIETASCVVLQNHVRFLQNSWVRRASCVLFLYCLEPLK